MKLKTYTAQTMAQALAQVRKDLGKDAMILHTRSYKVGAWFGIGGKNMVEITASSPKLSSQSSNRGRPSVAQQQRVDTDRSLAIQQTQSKSTDRVPEIVIQRGSTITRQRLAHTQTHSVGQSAGTQAVTQSVAQQKSTAKIANVSSTDTSQVPVDPSGLQGRDALFADPSNTQRSESLSKPTRKSRTDRSRIGKLSSPSIDRGGVQQQNTDSARNLSDKNEPPMVSIPANRPEIAPKQAQAHQNPATNDPETNKDQATPQSQGSADSATNEELRDQIDSLQKMMGQVLESTRKTAVVVGSSNPEAALPTGEMPAPLFELYAKMIDNDVPVNLADQMVGTVRDRLDSVELKDPQIVRQALLKEVESTIRTRSESLLNIEGTLATDRPRVIALVGPTGVGKTTTVAKLAATYKLRHGKKVGLITSDTYRIAAVEQLKTYAGIIELPLKVANSPEEMRQAIDELGDCDIVVIDTAGRSQNDSRRIDELAEFAKSANPDETHLVLSSTVGDNVLRKTAQRFSALGPDRCILTKLDEAVTTGTIAGLCDRIGLPLSFVTVGQEVPDDIEPARADRLARCVIDGPEAVVRRWSEDNG